MHAQDWCYTERLQASTTRALLELSSGLLACMFRFSYVIFPGTIYTGSHGITLPKATTAVPLDSISVCGIYPVVSTTVLTKYIRILACAHRGGSALPGQTLDVDE